MICRDGKLYPEDFSFCERARALGYRPHVTLKPSDHTGTITFVGNVGQLRLETPRT